MSGPEWIKPAADLVNVVSPQHEEDNTKQQGTPSEFMRHADDRITEVPPALSPAAWPRAWDPPSEATYDARLDASRRPLPIPDTLRTRDIGRVPNAAFEVAERDDRYPMISPFMPFETFREHLLDIHSTVTGMERVFTDEVIWSGTVQPWTISSFYPHPDDRQQILRYGLQQARAMPEMADMIIPVTIISAHCLLDGNGRAQRVAHALLNGYSAATIDELNIAGLHAHAGRDNDAREIIDLSPPYQLDTYIHGRAYEIACVDPGNRPEQTFGPDDSQVVKDLMAREGLSQEQYAEIWKAFKVPPGDWQMNPSEDPTGIFFAAARHGLVDRAGRVDTTALFTAGEGALHEFEQSLWDYRGWLAIAKIDCFGPTEFADRVVDLPGWETPETIRDHYIRLTNNLRTAD